MADRYRSSNGKYGKTLDGLNATWDLHLPRFHKEAANRARSSLKATVQRCSGRIHYLCERSDSGIDGAVAEFSEAAQYILSQWTWKPSQEKGTLPTLPASRSLLKRDLAAGRGRQITADLRQSLLQKLSSLVDDEYALALDSQNYQRTSSQSTSNTLSRTTSFASRNTSFTTAASTPPESSLQPVIVKSERGSASSDVASNKRRKTSGEAKEGKRSKVESGSTSLAAPKAEIKNYFSQSKSSSHSQPYAKPYSVSHSFGPSDKDEHGPSTSKPAYNIISSFDSATSPRHSVFSPVQHHSPSSSNNTSFNFDDQNSQNYFPTQEVREYLADESFASALDIADTVTPVQVFSFENISKATPFERVQQLPANLCFWLRWEIHRVAQATELEPTLVYNAIKHQLDEGHAPYDQLWRSLHLFCKENGKTLPARSDIRPWMEEARTFEAPDGKTVYFSFNLEYNRTPDPCLWKLILNPIKIDKGNRIHRRFGADRHIMGNINYFDKGSLPKWVTQRADYDPDEASRIIASWLATKTHHIAGREWRAFYLEQDKNQRRQPGEAPRQKLSLFAIDGSDMTRSSSQSKFHRNPIPITDFVNWHIPLQDNIHSTHLKLFSRFGLGLSKTRATVVLKPDQFKYLPDTEPVMNDGCALMSIHMASAIWDICGDGTSDVPSAIQGRHGGAKGLWIVDYRSIIPGAKPESPWIQISDSQLKIKPHPRDRHDADETHRTFEVLKWSTQCSPGHLNTQLIIILADRGVSRSTLRQIVLNDIEEYIEASRAAIRDPRQLQAWLQDYHRTDKNERPVSFEDGLPEMKEDEASFLVESGFDAEGCDHLRQGIVSLMTQRLNVYVEKLRIEVPFSTSVFCVPDPYQVLEEDEVYLGFSNPWKNPRTGLKETALHDIDLLVARTPAALASDIQKRKAVYKSELRHFKDVIIFSTKGKTPLASLLSGGDYDGDTVTVIWDPELVDSFQNVEKPELPSEDQCGLQKVARKLTSIIKGSPPSEKDIDEFLTSCILFNAQPSRLGTCTNEHEKLIYSGAKLSDQGSILLATLAGYLVDASKQGLAQTEQSWFRLRKTAQGGRKLLPLAYKTGQDLPRKWDNGECINIIDHLKFDVAMKRKQDVLVEFEKMLANASAYDRALTFPYLEQYNRSRDKNDPETKHVAMILEHLKKRLDSVVDEWQRRSGKRLKNLERSSFSTDVRHISGMIRDITPPKCDCNIYRDFLQDEMEMINAKNTFRKGSRWSLLRASTMYKYYFRSKITWWAVGDELCRIKAKSIGATRELAPDRHHVLKADTKYIKRLAGLVIDNDGDDSDG